MSAARALHLLIFGFTMLRFIGCYSDGSLLTDQCQSMAIDHGVQPPGQDSIIFSVDPDNVIVDSSQVGTGITVTLSSSGSFMGFMLEARECDDCPPAGTFSLLDPVNSLLLCGDQAVAQPNNDDKTSVLVTWTPQATGQFYFRAAFVQSYNFGSPKKAIILPTTTTLPLVGMTMATSPPATTPTMTQTMMKTDYAFSSTVTKTITQTTTTQTMTQTTTSTDTTATVTTSRTTIDTSTAPPTSAVGSTQTGLTVFTTPNLQATVSAVNTTKTDPTTNTTLTSNTRSQTTVSAVNTTQTDLTKNTTLTSNTRSQTTVNTTQTKPTSNTNSTTNTQSQTTGK
nr:mucin-2-like isoform X2 [Danio rerio]|eukprot:XP_021334086.1 mucin-2-like isoform X2 [Danio rerio]